MNKKIASPTASLVSQNIKRLMDESGKIEAEVARQAGLPQTTINRLLLGETLDPRASTLVPIAKFFGVTVGQLLGEEPMNPNRIHGTYVPINKKAWATIPIVEWEDINSWPFQKNNYTPNNHSKWIHSVEDIDEDAFGLETRDFMEPRFRRGSVIIVDTHCPYKDGQFVIISIANSVPTVRRVVKDGAEIYLKKLFGQEEPEKLKTSDRIIGTIVETRINEKH